jgi:hypothetical protein
MKSQEQIKDKLIELNCELMNNNEAIKTFSSCFGRDMTRKEKLHYDLKTFLFEAQKDVLIWVLENK